MLKSGHVGNLFLAARTAAVGMPLGMAALLLLGHVLECEDPPRGAFLLSGLLAGGLPLVHGHSFLVATGIVGWYACVGRRHGRRWAYCVLPLLVVAAPQLAWLARTGAPSYLRLAGGFLRPAPDAAEWLLDLTMGLGLWLLVVPLAFVSAPARARRLALPLLLLLPLANTVTFTPTVYDNVKLLAWFDVAAAVLVAGLLARLVAGSERGAGSVNVMAAGLVLLGCTLSGALAVGHELANDALVFTRQDASLAALVLERTEPDDVLATAASYHDPVALLTGRRVVLATPRMLDTHGIDARERARDLLRLYAGDPEALHEMRRLGVSAIVVGHRERRALPELDEAFLRQQALEHHERDGERLYLLR